jgi:DNA mismatch endonuclease Vsr
MAPQSSRFERQITNLIRHDLDPDWFDGEYQRLRGNPDLASSYAKVAIFIDGCYWHGCLEHTKDSAEAAARRARDERVTNDFTARGWIVLRLWEHEEHLAPFIADAKAVVAQRAARRRVEVLTHIADHGPKEWCTTCELWPHEFGEPDAEGDCARCGQCRDDHEREAWDPGDVKLFGPA